MWSLGTIIIEMMNGKPLFQGDSEICQLMHIFKQIGTPNEMNWKGVSKLKDFQSNFPKWQSKSWSELVPQPYCNDLGRDLLSKLVALDPTKRITAKQALKHPYFDDYLQRINQNNNIKNNSNGNNNSSQLNRINSINEINDEKNDVNNRIMSWRQHMPNAHGNTNTNTNANVNMNSNGNMNANMTMNTNGNGNGNGNRMNEMHKENINENQSLTKPIVENSGTNKININKTNINGNNNNNSNNSNNGNVLHPNTSRNRQFGNLHG